MAAAAVSFSIAEAAVAAADWTAASGWSVDAAAATTEAIDSIGRADSSAIAANGSTAEGAVYTENTEAEDIVDASTNAEESIATGSAYCGY